MDKVIYAHPFQRNVVRGGLMLEIYLIETYEERIYTQTHRKAEAHLFIDHCLGAK